MIDMKALRDRLGMNQAEFASFIGLANKATVSRMENDKEPIGHKVQMALTDKARILDLEEEVGTLKRLLAKELHRHDH